MKNIACTVFLIVLCAASTASAVDWWPTVDGAEFRYENDVGEELIVTIEDRGDGSYARVSEQFGFVIHQIFTIAEDGGVRLTMWEKYDQNGVFIESRTTDILIIQSPIQPGSLHGGPFYQFDQDGGVYYFEAIIIVSPEMISVGTPAGTFETYRLSISIFQGICYCSGGYYLDKQLGPVRFYSFGSGWDLVSWSGIVSNEETTWGDLKAAYR